MQIGKRLEVAAKMWKLGYVESIEADLNSQRVAAVRQAKLRAEEEQNATLERKVIIEQRKEEQERKSMLVSRRFSTSHTAVSVCSPGG